MINLSVWLISTIHKVIQRRIWFHPQPPFKVDLTKATMSLPTFTFDTTADDVATVFANEIRGKNGIVSRNLWLPHTNLIDSIDHRNLHQRNWLRGRSGYRQVCKYCHYHRIQRREVRQCSFVIQMSILLHTQVEAI